MEKNRTAKINQEIADEIRQVRKEQKLTYREIAARYSISVGTVERVVNGGSWVQLKLPEVK